MHCRVDARERALVVLHCYLRGGGGAGPACTHLGPPVAPYEMAGPGLAGSANGTAAIPRAHLCDSRAGSTKMRLPGRGVAGPDRGRCRKAE